MMIETIVLCGLRALSERKTCHVEDEAAIVLQEAIEIASL